MLGKGFKNKTLVYNLDYITLSSQKIPFLLPKDPDFLEPSLIDLKKDLCQ